MKILLAKVNTELPYAQYAHLETLLPKARIEQISRYRFDADKIRSLAAGVMLHRELELYCREKQLDMQTVTVVTGEHGKPYLEGATDFYFSISHAGEYVALAVDDEPVGLDVEKLQHRVNVAKRFYSEREQEAILQAQGPEIEFTKIWTAKEAFLKYTGKGLADPLAEIDVLNLEFLQEKKVAFSGMPVGDGTYYLTVCSEKEINIGDFIEEMCLL